MIEKIEALVNFLMIWLVQTTKIIIKKIVPETTLNKIRDKIEYYKQRKFVFKEKVKANLYLAWQKLKDFKEHGIKNRIDPIKNKINELLEKSKDLAPKQIIQMIKDGYAHVYGRIKTFFESLEPRTLVTGLVVCCLSLVGIINIYVSSKKILSDKTIRGPAAAAEVPKKFRTDYYRQEDKFYAMGNFRMPIYTGETQHTLKSLQIEFVVQTSNRYSKNFLQNRDIVSRDFVNRKLEPFIPEFTLSEEGKQVIKSKIKEELDNLLIENKVEGKILNIYINDLMTN